MDAEPIGWKTYAGTTLTGFIPNTDPGVRDELEEYLAESMQDPEFRAAYEAALMQYKRAWLGYGGLAVDGREYQRRLRNRRRRRR